MSAPARTAVVIACGGRGSRMGGDKGERLLGGQRLLDRAIGWALEQSPHVALAVRAEQRVEGVHVPVLVDSRPDLGPISALTSAFRFAHSRGCAFAVLAGCDQPFLPRDLVARLLAAIGAAEVAMPISEGHAQPLGSLWRVDEAALEDCVASSGRSIMEFAKARDTIPVEWGAANGTPDPFFNVNTLDDLALAERFVG